MAVSAENPNLFDPFGIGNATNEWCCLLKAAQEMRDSDQELMETLMEPDGPDPVTLSPESAAKLRSIAKLMRSLDLDPVAVRTRHPEAMRQLEAACLGCQNRSRCARALWAGTAADTYRDFCPNAVRLDQLRNA